MFIDAAALDGTKEARPARARLELRVGREERRATAGAVIRAARVVVPVRVVVRRLGAGLAKHVVLLVRETCVPLRVGEHELRADGRDRLVLMRVRGSLPARA